MNKWMNQQMIQSQVETSTLNINKLGREDLSKAVAAEQRSRWREGAEVCQNPEEHSRKWGQQIWSPRTRRNLTYSRNSKFSVVETEWAKRRGMWDEVREESRSQIMHNLIGHGKTSGFYTECEGKPMVAYKQERDKIWLKKIASVVR